MIELVVPPLLYFLSLWVAPKSRLRDMVPLYEKRPTSLETLPAEVILLISEHMSVKDLVRVMQVRRPQTSQNPR
jgi:hypothetical protein